MKMIRLKQFMKKTKIFLEEKTSFGFFLHPSYCRQSWPHPFYLI